MSKDFSQLEKLGFTKQEIDVYVNMVSSYYRTLEEVMIGTNLSKDDVLKATDKLKAQGYCKVIPGKVNQYIALVPNLPITSDTEKKIAEDFKKLEVEVNDSWIKAKESLKNFLDDFYSEINLIGQKTKDESKGFAKTIQATVEDFSTELKESNASNLQKIHEESKAILQNKFESLKETLNSAVEDLLSVYANEADEMGSKLSEIESAAIKMLENLKNERVKAIDSYQTEVEEKIVPGANTILETLSSLKTRTGEIYSEIETEVKDLTTELNNYTAKQGDEVVGSFSKNSVRLEEIASEIETIIQENIEAIRSATEKFNTDARNLVNELIKTHIENARESVNDYREKVNARIQDLGSQKVEIQRTHTEYSNAAMTVKDTIEGEVAKIQEEIANFIQEDYSSAAQLLEENNQLTEKSLEGKKEHVVTRMGEISSQLGSELNKHLESVNGVITNKKEELKSTLAGLADQQDEKIKEIHTQVVNNLDEKTTELTAFKDSTKADLEKDLAQRIQATSGKNISEIESAKKTFSNSSTLLTRQIIEQLESFSGSGQMLVGTMQESISMTAKNHEESFVKILIENRDNSIQLSDNLVQNAGDSLKKTSEFLGEVFSTQMDNFKQLETDIVDTFSSSIDTKSSEAKQALTDLSQEIDEKNSKILEEIPDALELFKTDHRAKLEQFEREIRGNLNRLKTLVEELHEALTVKKFKDKEREAFAAKLDEAKTELEPAMAKFTNLIRDQAAEFGNEIDDHLETFISTLQTLNEDSKASLTRNIEGFSNSVANLKEEIASTVSETLSNGSKLLDEKKKESTSQVDNLGQSIADSISSAKNNIASTTDSIIEKSKEMTENVLNEVETHVNGLLSAYTSVSEQATSEARETLDNQSSAILAALDGAVKSTSETFTGIEKEFVESFLSRNEKMTTAFKDAVDSFKEKTSSIEDDLKNVIQESVDSITEETVKIFETSVERNQELKDKFSEAITSRINEMTEFVNNELPVLKNSLIQKASSVVESINSNKDVLMVNLQTTCSSAISQSKISIDERLTEVGNAVRSMDNVLAELSSTAEGGLKIDLEEQENIVIKLGTDSTAQIDSTASDLAKFATDASDLFENVNEKITSLNTTLQANREKALSTLKAELSEVLDKQQKEIAQRTSNISSAIKTQFDNVDSTHKDFDKTLTDTKDILVNQLGNINSAHKDMITNQTGDLLSQMENISTKPSETIDLKIKATRSELAQHVSGHLNKISSDVDTIISSLDGESERIKSEAATYTANLVKNVQEKTDSHINTAIEKTEKIISETKNKTMTAEGTLATDVEATIKSIPERIKQGMAGTADILTFIRSIHTFVMDAEPDPVETSTFITGHDRVKDAIGGAMLRTISSTKFLLPKITDLKESFIEQIPRTKRIQGLCEINDRVYYDMLAEKYPNLDVRDYSHNVYGYIKDGNEEGGLGSSTKTKAEMLITTNEDMISAMNQIFLDFWPRAKKL